MHECVWSIGGMKLTKENQVLLHLLHQGPEHMPQMHHSL